MSYYGKIHRKLPIFCVKSVKIYTRQIFLHRHRLWCLWQIKGMSETLTFHFHYRNYLSLGWTSRESWGRFWICWKTSLGKKRRKNIVSAIMFTFIVIIIYFGPQCACNQNGHYIYCPKEDLERLDISEWSPCSSGGGFRKTRQTREW